jgi:hypothetical protein
LTNRFKVKRFTGLRVGVLILLILSLLLLRQRHALSEWATRLWGIKWLGDGGPTRIGPAPNRTDFGFGSVSERIKNYFIY